MGFWGSFWWSNVPQNLLFPALDADEPPCKIWLRNRTNTSPTHKTNSNRYIHTLPIGMCGYNNRLLLVAEMKSSENLKTRNKFSEKNVKNAFFNRTCRMFRTFRTTRTKTYFINARLSISNVHVLCLSGVNSITTYMFTLTSAKCYLV